jgi:hypothetical protein
MTDEDKGQLVVEDYNPDTYARSSRALPRAQISRRARTRRRHGSRRCERQLWWSVQRTAEIHKRRTLT